MSVGNVRLIYPNQRAFPNGDRKLLADLLGEMLLVVEDGLRPGHKCFDVRWS